VAYPSSYSDELALEICTRLAEGESLKRICSDEGMPNRSTVNAWRRDHPAFSAMFARAREDCSDTMAEAAVAVAMTATSETARPCALSTTR
jgi:transposase-like protein